MTLTNDLLYLLLAFPTLSFIMVRLTFFFSKESTLASKSVSYVSLTAENTFTYITKRNQTRWQEFFAINTQTGTNPFFS